MAERVRGDALDAGAPTRRPPHPVPPVPPIHPTVDGGAVPGGEPSGLQVLDHDGGEAYVTFPARLGAPGSALAALCDEYPVREVSPLHGAGLSRAEAEVGHQAHDRPVGGVVDLRADRLHLFDRRRTPLGLLNRERAQPVARVPDEEVIVDGGAQGGGQHPDRYVGLLVRGLTGEVPAPRPDVRAGQLIQPVAAEVRDDVLVAEPRPVPCGLVLPFRAAGLEPLGEPRRDGHGDRRRPSTAGQLTDEPLRLPLGGEPGGPLSAALTPRHAPLFRLAGPVSMDARHDRKGSPDSGECCPIRCPKRPSGRRGTPKTAWTSSGGYRDRTGGLLLAKQTRSTVGPCRSLPFPACEQAEPTATGQEPTVDRLSTPLSTSGGAA